MSERLALRAAEVSKRYGSCDALSRVNISTRPGELHGLLGPNGAGKTTLLRVVLGLVQRDAGHVELLGRPLDSLGAPLPEGVAGFVETPGFYPYLTGRHNLALLARLDDVASSSRRALIGEALEQTALSSEADRTVSGYSTGMRQRLGLAAALLRSPRLLFLDEPTSSLDPAAARDVRAVTRRLADAGAAVVFSSHDMSEVEGLCSTLTVMNHGCVIFSGTVEALRGLAPPAFHLMRTSDDETAIDVSSGRRGIRVVRTANDEGGLEVFGQGDGLDSYVIALGCAGVAVRVLEKRTRSLESLFLELTRNADAVDARVPQPGDLTQEPSTSPMVVS